MTSNKPSSSSSTPPQEEQSLELQEMSEKLKAYQNFMTSYIVNAQEEKMKAIKTTEQAVSTKYEEKLNQFLLKGAPEEPPVKVTVIKNDD